MAIKSKKILKRIIKYTFVIFVSFYLFRLIIHVIHPVQQSMEPLCTNSDCLEEINDDMIQTQLSLFNTQIV